MVMNIEPKEIPKPAKPPFKTNVGSQRKCTDTGGSGDYVVRGKSAWRLGTGNPLHLQ
jgi:hypothetical protein